MESILASLRLRWAFAGLGPRTSAAPQPSAPRDWERHWEAAREGEGEGEGEGERERESKKEAGRDGETFRTAANRTKAVNGTESTPHLHWGCERHWEPVSGEREKERDRDRARETDRQRERDRERETKLQRESEREWLREWEIETERSAAPHPFSLRHGEALRAPARREREGEGEGEGERERERERERKGLREIHKEGGRER
jgi:hypothetical protein